MLVCGVEGWQVAGCQVPVDLHKSDSTVRHHVWHRAKDIHARELAERGVSGHAR